MLWKIIDTGENHAQTNMDIDDNLLQAMEANDPPILHLYKWKGESITYGHFIKTAHFFDMENIRKNSFELARRPTGGGIIFHSWDYTFSVLVPSNNRLFSNNTLENYRWINQVVLDAIQDLYPCPLSIHEKYVAYKGNTKYFCMAKPTIYDILLGEKKVVGAAQRRRRNGLLHQGSISISMPDFTRLEEILLPNTEILLAMREQSHYLYTNPTSNQLEEMRSELENRLKKAFSNL